MLFKLENGYSHLDFQKSYYF